MTCKRALPFVLGITLIGAGCAGNGVGIGSEITIITIYRLLSVCRADNRDSIVRSSTN